VPKVVITHSVVDVEQWLKGKSERAEAIAGMGGANVVDHVAHDGSKTIAVTFDTDDVPGLMDAVAAPSPDLAAAMERHGVLPPLSVFVEK
jgi:hypothetical protein